MSDRPEIPDKMFFRIGDAASLVGVEAHVLRYWETEFRMRPQRSSSGQRMYRRKDLERFLRIKSLVHDQGFTIAGARKALQDGRHGAEVGIEPARVVDALTRIDNARTKIKAASQRLIASSLRDLTGTR
ncbi:MAG: MerR family transcriptional regulator [Myxococcota bacterium]